MLKSIIAAGTLLLTATLATAANMPPVGEYRFASGVDCKDPESVQKLYTFLDTLPEEKLTVENVMQIIAIGVKNGVMCRMAANEEIALVGRVGQFKRLSDGATMGIYKYVLRDGTEVFSWAADSIT